MTSITRLIQWHKGEHNGRNKDDKRKTIELIDALKATCQTYGMGNDGNEYKIITQVFLYKFLNDKFGYEVKKVSPVLKNAEKWELAYAEMSEDDRLDILIVYRQIFHYLIRNILLPTYGISRQKAILI